MRLGEINGNLQYKMNLLRFMNGICEAIGGISRKESTSIYGLRWLRKLHAVSRKLQTNMPISINPMQTWLTSTQLHNERLTSQKDHDVDGLHKDPISESELMPLIGLSLEQDSKHCIPNLREYIKNRSHEHVQYWLFASRLYHTVDKGCRNDHLNFGTINVRCILVYKVYFATVRYFLTICNKR